ncbi:MAG: hypothetical protein Sylvanvirus37_1, partial [Sylvanvirus sp.]
MSNMNVTRMDTDSSLDYPNPYAGGWIGFQVLLSVSIVFSGSSFILMQFHPRFKFTLQSRILKFLCGQDFIWSSLCLSQCIINDESGVFYGGSAFCRWQSIYMFFFILMNGFTLCVMAYSTDRRTVLADKGLSDGQLPQSRHYHRWLQSSRSILFIHLLGWTVAASLSLLTNIATADAVLEPSQTFCFVSFRERANCILFFTPFILFAIFLIHRYRRIFNFVVATHRSRLQYTPSRDRPSTLNSPFHLSVRSMPMIPMTPMIPPLSPSVKVKNYSPTHASGHIHILPHTHIHMPIPRQGRLATIYSNSIDSKMRPIPAVPLSPVSPSVARPMFLVPPLSLIPSIPLTTLSPLASPLPCSSDRLNNTAREAATLLQRNIARRMVIFVMSYVLCSFPAALISLCQFISPTLWLSKDPVFYLIAAHLIHANAILNPFLCLTRPMRKELWTVMCFWRWQPHKRLKISAFAPVPVPTVPLMKNSKVQQLPIQDNNLPRISPRPLVSSKSSTFFVLQCMFCCIPLPISYRKKSREPPSSDDGLEAHGRGGPSPPGPLERPRAQSVDTGLVHFHHPRMTLEEVDLPVNQQEEDMIQIIQEEVNVNQEDQIRGISPRTRPHPQKLQHLQSKFLERLRQNQLHTNLNNAKHHRASLPAN